MRVDAAGCDNLALACDHFSSRSDNYRDVGLHIGIASFAYCGNMSIFNSDIGLHNSRMIENQGVGDDGIHCAVAAGTLRLTHAVANYLPTSELHLLAVGRVVLLHLDDDLGIRKSYLLAHRWAKHLR